MRYMPITTFLASPAKALKMLANNSDAVVQGKSNVCYKVQTMEAAVRFNVRTQPLPAGTPVLTIESSELKGPLKDVIKLICSHKLIVVRRFGKNTYALTQVDYKVNPNIDDVIALTEVSPKKKITITPMELNNLHNQSLYFSDSWGRFTELVNLHFDPESK